MLPIGRLIDSRAGFRPHFEVLSELFLFQEKENKLLVGTNGYESTRFATYGLYFS